MGRSVPWQLLRRLCSFFLLFLLSAAQNVDGMGQSGVAVLDRVEMVHGEKRSNESDFLKTSFQPPIMPPEPSCSSLVTCS